MMSILHCYRLTTKLSLALLVLLSTANCGVYGPPLAPLAIDPVKTDPVSLPSMRPSPLPSIRPNSVTEGTR
jgi:hypothetical protein